MNGRATFATRSDPHRRRIRRRRPPRRRSRCGRHRENRQGKLPLARDPEFLAVRRSSVRLLARRWRAAGDRDRAVRAPPHDPARPLRLGDAVRHAHGLPHLSAKGRIKLVDLEKMEAAASSRSARCRSTSPSPASRPRSPRVASRSPIRSRNASGSSKDHSHRRRRSRAASFAACSASAFSAETEKQFPTGVDRVVARGSRWLAFDSSTGTLYNLTTRETTVLARGLATPHAFALTPEEVAYWRRRYVGCTKDRSMSDRKLVRPLRPHDRRIRADLPLLQLGPECACARQRAATDCRDRLPAS